ncbi:MerR family transcriptional regulator [Abyssalbus ytuae]|uniref:MerR family transcriptional regulator n=1 Tax=Abyssalbus ytuae TaxID=2926907 RepID=A0A9E7D3X5_9FLAO|nr:MerR family transcriptional regulator [Abyssalbus ytuae]UOB18294.1 MerR family transcriptional regulator [Abyssalbus ytuae]
MNIVKDNFSIKDLENLSGIKAHTIRIWEKRYRLLSPKRTNTNIRYYSLGSLQKLLNITMLYNNGYKISRIAEIPEDKIPVLVREIVSENSIKDQSINSFKLAMVNFDQGLFSKTYNNLLSSKTFREIFYDVFIPLLEELGLLWQTDTITPAHEHFITGLIKQKIIINIERLQVNDSGKNNKVFVLFLPENEIHEIGLLYLNYEILLRGYQSIYLGPTIPMESLTDLLKYFSNITFLSYFTIEPNKERINTYLQKFNDTLLTENNKLWVLGHLTNEISLQNSPNNIRIFNSIAEISNFL